jgi:UDP-N-acetylmuramoylalanine--D-glutamate ligase
MGIHIDLYPPRTLVVGLGESGYWAAKSLLNHGVKVTVVDGRPEEQLDPARIKGLESALVELLLGEDLLALAHRSEYLDEFGLVVISPGVSMQHPLVKTIQGLGLPLLGELEWALLQLPQTKLVVTGSNGKSTTVALISHLLRGQGYVVHMVGNCGIAVSSLLSGESIQEDAVLVVEASSYQLEVSHSFVPDFGLLLNISENHLERHGSLERYVAAKLKPFARMSKGTLVYGTQLEELDCARSQMSNVAVKKVSFGVAASKNLHCRLSRHNLSVPLDSTPLVGMHNRLNVEAALTVIGEFCASIDADALMSSLGSFCGLEHRIELLGDSGRIWINDSKATTPVATLSAVSTVLQQWPGLPIYLIVGGALKQASWAEVWAVLLENRDRFERIVCVGAGGPTLYDQVAECGLPAWPGAGLKEGICRIAEEAPLNSVVLFSPGCASFDEFSDFEERGRFFKSMVNRIEGVQPKE